jgi:hypothetical protein
MCWCHQSELNRIGCKAASHAGAQLQRQPSISSLSVAKQATVALAAARQWQDSGITDIFGCAVLLCGGSDNSPKRVWPDNVFAVCVPNRVNEKLRSVLAVTLNAACGAVASCSQRSHAAAVVLFHTALRISWTCHCQSRRVGRCPSRCRHVALMRCHGLSYSTCQW